MWPCTNDEADEDEQNNNRQGETQRPLSGFVVALLLLPHHAPLRLPIIDRLARPGRGRPFGSAESEANAPPCHRRFAAAIYGPAASRPHSGAVPAWATARAGWRLATGSGSMPPRIARDGPRKLARRVVTMIVVRGNAPPATAPRSRGSESPRRVCPPCAGPQGTGRRRRRPSRPQLFGTGPIRRPLRANTTASQGSDCSKPARVEQAQVTRSVLRQSQF